MFRPTMKRRTALKALTAGLFGLPALLRCGPAWAQNGQVRRFIVFYFPDGIAGPSEQGDASLWTYESQLAALAPWRDRALVINGLTMGPTDEGSHPGGAKKLLTAMDGGRGMSIDRWIAANLGQNRPHRHVYLGAMANQNGASGDKHISYPGAEFTAPPWDDPVQAFEQLFGGGAVQPGDPGAAEANARRAARLSVLDGVRGELSSLKAGLGAGEVAKLDLHLDALREVEQRIQAMNVAPPPMRDACRDAPPSVAAIERGERLYAPEQFPQVLRAQTDLMVEAMACGLTQVGVIQASHHTSELIMSRFRDTPLHDAGFDMRSHQASHYGPRHDPGRREFAEFVKQRQWFVSQYAYLLEQLAARPEGDGTMLDHTVCLLCSEVSDGNTHRHHDMPFVLAGGQATGVRGGQTLETRGARHADLLVSIARSMGADLERYGDPCNGPLPGVLG